MITGSDPRSMTVQPLQGDSELPCVSKHSLVDMGDYAIYATHSGLALADGVSVSLVTKELMDKKSWVAYVPSSFVSGYHEGRYLAFYDTGSVTGGIIFDPMGGKNALTTTSLWSDALYHDPSNGALYAKQGTDIGKWDAGTELAYTWRSKVFTAPFPIGFTYLEILGTVTSTTALIGHGESSFTVTATTAVTVLPAVDATTAWWIQLSGVDVILLASLTEVLGSS